MASRASMRRGQRASSTPAWAALPPKHAVNNSCGATGIEPTAEVDFTALHGIGPRLAARIRDQLKARTFEQLELAAHTGRLQTLAGVGPGRAHHIRAQLQQRFGAAREAAHPPKPALRAPPSVAELLWIDHEYRVQAKVGVLARVVPKRLNPTRAAWLPILRTTHGGIDYTAFFSNTEAAHRAGKTHNWVIVLAQRDGRANQYTILSETRGDWRGQRVVRGREAECREYYATVAAA